jgi:hypothetical protein
LTVTWSGSPIGSLKMGDVKVIGDIGADINMQSIFEITDVNHLTEFTKVTWIAIVVWETSCSTIFAGFAYAGGVRVGYQWRKPDWCVSGTHLGCDALTWVRIIVSALGKPSGSLRATLITVQRHRSYGNQPHIKDSHSERLQRTEERRTNQVIRPALQRCSRRHPPHD